MEFGQWLNSLTWLDHVVILVFGAALLGQD